MKVIRSEFQFSENLHLVDGLLYSSLEEFANLVGYVHEIHDVIVTTSSKFYEKITAIQYLKLKLLYT